ncbi:MAG TPA: hypothetical protein VNV43_09855 [Candidatus Acidoferrales bacterium]|jgi:hypothetical protein|nr:hypothetical protein [Candidatus Acidoferrales bacterium]
MKTNPTFDEPLLPSLFQFTDRASDLRVQNRSTFAELMLNPKRLDAILKAIGKRKKSTPRRTS